MRPLAFALAFMPVAAFAEPLTVTDAMVPTAPPNAMAHAGYMTLTNDGDTAVQLVDISAEGYAMAHLHKSEVKDDVATMSAVDLIEIAPGQSVTFQHGGLHVMLMRPEASVAEGDTVTMTLVFADGTTQKVDAPVKRLKHSDGHGS